MMRRATAAAARGLVEDTREGESSGIAIPTLNWPPDPSAPFDATARAGKRLFLQRRNQSQDFSLCYYKARM